ncbi:MAG: radical SAM/SPASM family putative metalloenzyme maturase [Desulfobulbaceae bacterium]|nr:MAG: radical SAM/SPASM family putative metalloenzyme maturase [Desulfobulbaceae bacterium]
MRSICPEKLYVELTTRCNLHCPMCVKQADGSDIAEGDLPLDTFKRLLPSLGHIRSLILNGIGEPLLHPDLEEIISLARSRMPGLGTIGFQSNGFLLDKQRAASLLQAGLDTLCLSLDSLEDAGSGGHALTAVSHAVEALIQARRNVDRRFRIGIEMVLSQETISGLPDLVLWAAGREVDYLIATHLFPYGKATGKDILFNPNSADAVDIFLKYNKAAAGAGLHLDDYLATYLKFHKTEADRQLLEIVERMQREAREKDIHLHLPSLIEHKSGARDAAEMVCSQARSIARQLGIELFLPPLQASVERSCPFITEKAAFVSINGDIMPCHFLWHSYSCRVLDEDIQVQERVFGNIREQSLEEIWQSADYRQFRQQAGSCNYAPCWSCSLGPCATLINDSLYANDCYGSNVPCGHCLWSLGGIRCL